MQKFGEIFTGDQGLRKYYSRRAINMLMAPRDATKLSPVQKWCNEPSELES